MASKILSWKIFLRARMRSIWKNFGLKADHLFYAALYENVTYGP